MTTIQRPAPRERHEEKHLWILILSLAAASVGLFEIYLMNWPYLPVEGSLGFVALLAGFVLSESLAISLPVRTRHGILSFSELPLVLGLFLARPATVWLASLLALLLTFIALRPTSLIDGSFAVANRTLRVATTALLFRLLFDQSDLLSPQNWSLALSAVAISGAIELAAVLWADELSQGRHDPGAARSIFALGLFVALANTSQAIVAAHLIVAQPLGLILFGVTMLVLYGAYHSYVSEYSHRLRVEFLFEMTNALRGASSNSAIAKLLLVDSAAMLKMDSAELVIFPRPENPDSPTCFKLDSGILTENSLTNSANVEASDLIAVLSTPTIIHPHRQFGLAANYLRGRGYHTALIGTLRSENRPVGLFIVGNRTNRKLTLDHDDLGLFASLVHQSAIALENDQLEQAISRLRVLESELAHQANHDSLTGLANRTLLSIKLTQTIAESLPTTLLYVDLDDFKVINDTLGHGVGDQLLTAVAHRILDCVRADDVVARLGGDEFAALICSEGDAHQMAKRILAALSRAFTIDGHEILIGASVGLASSSDVSDASDYLAKADVAMYAAKQQGKGAVATFRMEMQRQVVVQQRLRANLRQAIDAGKFHILYQPVVELSTRKIVGAEALVRWETDDGDILPGGFIEEAERAGLILAIDRFVLDRVLQDLQTLERQGSQVFLSANLSSRHFQEPDLVQQLKHSIENAQVRPERLMLEITEAALVLDPEVAVRTLNRIRHLGIRLALDDFGTGYSSLNHLRALPVDILKIARPFVRDLNQLEGETFLRTMIELGDNLGLQVLCQGIETEGQFLAVERLGCALGQGFLVSRPIPLTQLVDQVTLQPHRVPKLDLG